MRIPYVAPLAPYERTQVVRMSVPVTALIAAGFEVHARDIGAAVRADVLIGQDGRAMFATGFGQMRGFGHGRADGVEINNRLGPALADEVDIERHQARSRRKLISTAGAECVMAPAEMKSAPVSA